MSKLVPHRSLRYLACLTLSLAPVLAAQAQTRYTVTELPVLPGAALCNATGLNDAVGGFAGSAYAINDVGQIVGAGGPTEGVELRPVFWNNDAARTAHFLPALAGDNNAWAVAINNQGVVLGLSGFYNFSGPPAGAAPRAERPVVWHDGAVSELASLLDGAYALRSATAINSLGQIAATGSSGGGLVKALLLTPN